MASPAQGTAAGFPGWAHHPDPGGAPRVPVADIVCSLQFYLDELGCVVREVADGWALLRSGPFALLLIHEPTPIDPARTQASSKPQTGRARPHRLAGAASPISPPLIRVSTTDVHALRHRLGYPALAAGLVPGSARDSVDEIEIFDPDHHRVVISQLESGDHGAVGPADPRSRCASPQHSQFDGAERGSRSRWRCWSGCGGPSSSAAS